MSFPNFLDFEILRFISQPISQIHFYLSTSFFRKWNPDFFFLVSSASNFIYHWIPILLEHLHLKMLHKLQQSFFDYGVFNVSFTWYISKVMYRCHLSVSCTCKNQGVYINISNLNLLDLERQKVSVKSIFSCLNFDVSSSSLNFICCFLFA